MTDGYPSGTVFGGSNLAIIRHIEDFLPCASCSTRDKERVTGFRYPNTLPRGYPCTSHYLKLRVRLAKRENPKGRKSK
jgi:hypothetical protein